MLGDKKNPSKNGPFTYSYWINYKHLFNSLYLCIFLHTMLLVPTHSTNCVKCDVIKGWKVTLPDLRTHIWQSNPPLSTVFPNNTKLTWTSRLNYVIGIVVKRFIVGQESNRRTNLLEVNWQKNSQKLMKKSWLHFYYRTNKTSFFKA